mmetsp:Transcript_7488/g.16993  ORF Transcript_7488/g.16993 Transcript_7488/m.16993 type:complete len:209 (-) Transcript_7488:211-837(-)
MQLFLLLCKPGIHATLPNTTTVSVTPRAPSGAVIVPSRATLVRFLPRADAVVVTVLTIDITIRDSLCFTASGIISVSTTRFVRINARIIPAPGLFVFPDAFVLFTTLITVRVSPGTVGVTLSLTLLGAAPFFDSVAIVVIDSVTAVGAAVVNVVSVPVDFSVDCVTAPISAVVDVVSAPVAGLFIVIIMTGSSTGEIILEIRAARPAL